MNSNFEIGSLIVVADLPGYFGVISYVDIKEDLCNVMWFRPGYNPYIVNQSYYFIVAVCVVLSA